jgi:hypothetical protein
MRRLTLVFLLFATTAFAADLKITDSTNTVVVVHAPFIDYGGLVGDRELDGIRLYQGEAVVTAKWVNIRLVTITGKDSAAPQPHLKVEIVPRKGAKISTTLVSKGRMKLSGRTDLGDYAIDLEKIRVIEPVPPE